MNAVFAGDKMCFLSHVYQRNTSFFWFLNERSNEMVSTFCYKYDALLKFLILFLI